MDILHRVAVQHATPDQVYDALATLEGLASWWTRDVSGSTDVGGVIEFRFPPGGFDMEVVDTVPGRHVGWKVVAGADEWVGTTIDWDVRQDGDWTVLLFKHAGWKEPVEFMHRCSTKWATYLLSIKSLIETGAGRPSPHDLRIADPD